MAVRMKERSPNRMKEFFVKSMFNAPKARQLFSAEQKAGAIRGGQIPAISPMSLFGAILVKSNQFKMAYAF